jgi:hypothetical protein
LGHDQAKEAGVGEVAEADFPTRQKRTECGGALKLHGALGLFFPFMMGHRNTRKVKFRKYLFDDSRDKFASPHIAT